MLDLNVITELISPIIVIACLCLGYVIKHGIKNDIVDAFIPCLVACTGIAANIWANNGTVDLKIVVIGAVSGLASTGLYEAFTNLLNLPRLYAEQEHIQIEYGPKHLEDEE